MRYAYYPGCSLKGSAKGLDEGVRRVFSALGDELVEIPDWNCCGAFEFGEKERILALSQANIRKGREVSPEIIAPCPACLKNLREAADSSVSVLHPLEVFSEASFWDRLPMKRDLGGRPFTPYYGCILLRPREFALRVQDPIEVIITRLGGKVVSSQVKAQCCGGNLFFKELEVSEKLAKKVWEGASGDIVTFCPLCHLVLRTFSEKGRRVFYLTDLILYVMGERFPF